MKTQIMTAAAIFFMAKISAQEIKPQKTGKEIFEKHCSRCHGKTGTKGFLGAKNLQVTKLDDPSLFQVISKGKRIMPSWRRRLSESEINTVIGYIKTLRK